MQPGKSGYPDRLLEGLALVDRAEVPVGEDGGRPRHVHHRAPQVEGDRVHVIGRVAVLDPPLPLVGLDFDEKAGLLAYSLKVPIEPLQQVLHPVEPHHLRVGLPPPALPRTIEVVVRPVRVIVVPLAEKPLRLDARVLQLVDHGNGHVGVHVPIVHPLDQVDRTPVVVQHPVKEVPLLPVRSSRLPSPHVGSHPGAWADDVVGAHVAYVLLVAVDSVGAVDAVVHYRGSGLAAAVLPHELHDTD